MKVICFKGNGNTGKSTIIKKILNEFFNISLIPKDKKDFSLYFSYSNKKIGICSYGDNKKAMERWLKPLKENNCDIIICASRTKGEGIRFIENNFGTSNIVYITCDGNYNDNEKISKFKKIFNNFLFSRTKEFFKRLKKGAGYALIALASSLVGGIITVNKASLNDGITIFIFTLFILAVFALGAIILDRTQL